MTDADVFRKAAALMRERGLAAAEAWGDVTWSAGQVGCDDRQGLTYDVRAEGSLVAAAACEELAEHIAACTPIFIISLADWLDQHADYHNLPCKLDGCGALAVATAYLGGGQ